MLTLAMIVLGILLTDAMNVLERDDDALVGRDIHACNSGHDFTPVPAGAGAPRPCLPIPSFPEGHSKR